MHDIHLTALDIKLSIPDYMHYRDDGPQESLRIHTLDLMFKYRIRHPYRKMLGLTFEAPNSRMHGMCLAIKLIGYSLRAADSLHFHVYYTASLNDAERHFIRGHEETHVLLRMSHGTLLRNKLAAAGVNAWGLLQEPKELICDIGGICALINREHEDALDNLDLTDGLNWYLRRMGGKQPLKMPD